MHPGSKGPADAQARAGASIDDPAARAAERLRLARLAVVFGTVERAVSTAAGFIRIPLLLWGLGTYDYGLWTAILGIVVAANLLDFGLHYGAINAISDARGRNDQAAVGRTIATAFVTYLVIAALAAAALVPVLGWLPLDDLVGAKPEEAGLVRMIAAIGFGGLVLTMPLKVSVAGLTGYQEQWLVSLFRCVQMIGQLAVLAAAFALFGARLLAVAWVDFATQLASWAVLAAWVQWRRPALGIRLRQASRALAPLLLLAGVAFLTINVANLLKTSLASTIFAHSCQNPELVPALSVPLGLYMIAVSLAAMVAVSLWPAYGEAAARGEWQWIARAFALGTKVSLGVAAGLAVLGALYGADLIYLWARKAGAPEGALMAALAVWLIAQAGINAASSLLNGVGLLRAVMFSCVTEGVVVVGGSLLAVGAWGAMGIVTVMAAAGLANAAFLLVAVIPRATQGRVGPPLAILGRLAVCVAGGAGVGVVLRAALAQAHPAWRLAAGAGPTAAVVAVLFWTVLLDRPQRARMLARWTPSHNTPLSDI